MTTNEALAPAERFRFASLAISRERIPQSGWGEESAARTIVLRATSRKPNSLAFLTVPWPIFAAICCIEFTCTDDHVLLPILGGSDSVDPLEVPYEVAFIREANAGNDLLNT